MRIINDRGAVDAKQLADLALLHAPSITRILRLLEARDLIERRLDEYDRRRFVVVLTEEGFNVVKEISEDVKHYMREYSSLFGPERLERLLNELHALSAVLKGVEQRRE